MCGSVRAGREGGEAGGESREGGAQDGCAAASGASCPHAPGRQAGVPPLLLLPSAWTGHAWQCWRPACSACLFKSVVVRGLPVAAGVR